LEVPTKTKTNNKNQENTMILQTYELPQWKKLASPVN